MEEEKQGNQLLNTLRGLGDIDPNRLVRGMLYITGLRQTDIAKRHNIDKTVLSKVLSGKRKSRRVREAIAAELDVPMSSLWPDA